MQLFIKNIRNHSEKNIKFEKGVNLLSGPSGAGKTSILDSIWWTFTGLDGQKINSKSNHDAFSNIIYNDNSNNLNITRQKNPNRIQVVENEQKFIGNEAQALLDKIFVTRIKQQGFDNFLIATGQERKNMLEKLAGINCPEVENLNKNLLDMIKISKERESKLLSQLDYYDMLKTENGSEHPYATENIKNLEKNLELALKQQEQKNIFGNETIILLKEKLKIINDKIYILNQRDLKNRIEISKKASEEILILKQKLEERVKIFNAQKKIEELKNTVSNIDEIECPSCNSILQFDSLKNVRIVSKRKYNTISNLITKTKRRRTEKEEAEFVLSLDILEKNNNLENVETIEQLKNKIEKLKQKIVSKEEESKLNLEIDHETEIFEQVEQVEQVEKLICQKNEIENKIKLMKNIKLDDKEYLPIEILKNKIEQEKKFEKEHYDYLQFKKFEKQKQILVDQVVVVLKQQEKLIKILEIVNATCQEKFSQVLKLIESKVNSILSEWFDNATVTLSQLAKKVDISISKDGIYLTVDELSGGEKSRLSCALSLVVAEIQNSKIVLFDECLAGIDDEKTVTIVDTLKEWAQNNNSIIIICSHKVPHGIFDNVITV